MRTKRWPGAIPPEVEQAMSLLARLGHETEAQAALLALKPRTKIGRPRVDEAEMLAMVREIAVLWRGQRDLSLYEICKMISKKRGGVISHGGIRWRLVRHCRDRGASVEDFEASAKAGLDA
jgi:hypothetical protein